MYRLTLVALAFGLVACGKKSSPSPQAAVIQSEVCVPPENVTYLKNVTFPDGTIRKTTVSPCSDGCVRYAWTNDTSEYVTQCGQGLPSSY